MAIVDAYQRGRIDAQQGKGIADNPYEVPSEMADAWDQGWIDYHELKHKPHFNYEYYTWTEIDPKIGEGTIMAFVPDMGNINLITRNKAIAQGVFRAIALAHQQVTGHEVRLVRWTQRQDIEIIKSNTI